MLNRTAAPSFKQVEHIHFIEPEQKILANGIKFFAINAGQQELVRLEFIFNHVNWDTKNPLQALAVSGLINNGTDKLNAQQIAEHIDYYGAFLQTEYNADHINITLYSLNKHLPLVLPVIYNLFNDAVFPQSELAIYRQNQKQYLQVNLKKNDYVARKTFSNAIFGDTPYGADIALNHFDNIDREGLLHYYQAAFKADNCCIIAAGKLSRKEYGLIDKIFGEAWQNNQAAKSSLFKFESVSGSEIYLEKPQAVQSAIRIGNISINRTHPDYPALQFVNCLFGGYFGSRLMANIREDKGYTYGIGSGVVSLRQSGYFFIATQVGVEVCVNALSEIEKEINLLKNEKVTTEELSLVRNYMLGCLLGSLENAFSHADKFKNIYFSGLSYHYYQKYIDTIKNIDAQQVNNIANKYFDWNAMTKVIVGKK